MPRINLQNQSPKQSGKDKKEMILSANLIFTLSEASLIAVSKLPLVQSVTILASASQLKSESF